MSDTKIYWVKETALYRVPAKSPDEAMQRFETRTKPDELLDQVQERELFISTGRWTTKKIENA
jgi:hypothetical protein